MQIDIENSKFEVKPKDVDRLNKMAQEKQFAKILDAKVDLNFKIAKLLTNSLGWEIDFNSLRQGKQTIILPIKADETTPTPMETPGNLPQNAEDLFNQIEGNRNDVEIEMNNMNSEKDQDRDPQSSRVPREIYPLRKA
jgi:hypothetical protein